MDIQQSTASVDFLITGAAIVITIIVIYIVFTYYKKSLIK